MQGTRKSSTTCPAVVQVTCHAPRERICSARFDHARSYYVPVQESEGTSRVAVHREEGGMRVATRLAAYQAPCRVAAPPFCVRAWHRSWSLFKAHKPNQKRTRHTVLCQGRLVSGFVASDAVCLFVALESYYSRSQEYQCTWSQHVASTNTRMLGLAKQHNNRLPGDHARIKCVHTLLHTDLWKPVALQRMRRKRPRLVCLGDRRGAGLLLDTASAPATLLAQHALFSTLCVSGYTREGHVRTSKRERERDSRMHIQLAKPQHPRRPRDVLHALDRVRRFALQGIVTMLPLLDLVLRSCSGSTLSIKQL